MFKHPLKCGLWALEAGSCTALQSLGDVGTCDSVMSRAFDGSGAP